MCPSCNPFSHFSSGITLERRVTRWEEECVKRVLQLPGVRSLRADQCQYGLQVEKSWPSSCPRDGQDTISVSIYYKDQRRKPRSIPGSYSSSCSRRREGEERVPRIQSTRSGKHLKRSGMAAGKRRRGDPGYSSRTPPTRSKSGYGMKVDGRT